MQVLNKRIKIFLNYVVGPALLVWVIFSIYRQVQHQQHLSLTWKEMLFSLTGPQCWKLVATIILMLLNWGIEARKWQLLLRPLQALSFSKAFRSIFSGQAFAFSTLNGIGEYVGRLLYLDEGNRLRAVSLSMAGSISQLIVTLGMGIAGAVYLGLFNDHSALTRLLPAFWARMALGGVLVGTILLVMLYFGLAQATKLVEKISFVRRYGFLIDKVKSFRPKELTQILSLSLTRYIVFVVQYLLLLNVFNADGGFYATFWMISVIFLVLAIIPSIALAELGLRGEVSILLLGLLSTNTIGILLASTGIWIINRVIPALAGSLFILSVRLFKKQTL